jgi:hypothetical protein
MLRAGDRACRTQECERWHRALTIADGSSRR